MSTKPSVSNSASNSVSAHVSPSQIQVQIFGIKKSAATRAAERFFKERKVKIHFVDLHDRPIAKGELMRFVQIFGLNDLLDLTGKAYERSNLAYLRTTEEGVITKVIETPELLKLPLIRSGKLLAVGEDSDTWAAMLSAP